jgi:hypothetical protein
MKVATRQKASRARVKVNPPVRITLPNPSLEFKAVIAPFSDRNPSLSYSRAEASAQLYATKGYLLV